MSHQVEHAYEANNKTKVSLVAVSYGPQFALSFLHAKSQQWKDKYIRWFVAESPVWSGTPSTLLAFSAGYDPTTRDSQRFTREVSVETMSDFWLFPRCGNQPGFWNEVCACMCVLFVLASVSLTHTHTLSLSVSLSHTHSLWPSVSVLPTRLRNSHAMLHPAPV